MSWYYPYGFRWFQDGGNVLPGTMLSPWEAGRYMARGWYQDGGGTGWPAGVPTPREMMMQAALQRAFAPVQGSPSQNEVKKKEEPKRKVMLPPPEPRVRGDIGAGLPTRAQVEGLIQQRVAEQQRLQGQLERVGYKGAYAAAMSRQGRGKLPKNVQEQLDNQEASDYRVQHHPDYDPRKSVEDQQYLNYDNSLRTTVLRGANMFTDSGNPVADFVAEAVTSPGRAFANIVLDPEKRYVQPIVREGWRGVPESVGNLGMDVMTLATEGAVGNRVASRLAGRGLPEASAAMENQVLSFYTPGTPRVGRVSREVADEVSDVDDGLYEKTIRSKSNKQPSRSKKTNPFDTDPKTKEEIKRAALDYLNLTKDPRYRKRVRALDKELGLNGELERRLDLFQQQGEATMNDDLPFGIKINEEMGVFGRSSIKDDVTEQLDEDLIAGRISQREYDQALNRYFTPDERLVQIAPKAIKKDVTRSIPSTTWHELKHHWTSGADDPSVVPYSNYFAFITQPFPEATAKAEIFEKFPKWLDQLKKQHRYLNDPAEVDAYVMTNLRNMLVKKGYLKDHFDKLTEGKLNEFADYVKRNEELIGTKNYEPLPDWVNYYLDPKKGLTSDKKEFITVFNKALPVGVGVGAGLGMMSGQEEQKKWGGEKRRVPGMPLIGVRGLI